MKKNVLELRIIDGGSIEIDKSVMTHGHDMGERVRVPTPIYLIKTDTEYILFDTGWSSDVVPFLEDLGYKPEIAKHQLIPDCLEKAGVDVSDIKKVILSHLHVDHAGGIRYFPHAEFIVQKDEYVNALHPHAFGALAYHSADYDFPSFNWHLIEGDRVLMPGLSVILANGHTPGTQALVVDLPDSGVFILGGDACYTSQNIEEDIIPGIVWNPVLATHSIARLKTLGKLLNGTVVPGHDMDLWSTRLKKSPAAYT